MKDSFILTGINRPWASLILGLVLTVVVATGFTKLYKDTRADAFLSQDNPVLVYKDKVKEIFGLSDPVVIAIEDKSAAGVYNLQTLDLIQQITDMVNDLQNVNEDRTMSLAIDNNIVGDADGMNVNPFYDLLDEGGPQEIKKAIQNFPLYEGMLVSSDGKMTLIVAELMNDDQAQVTYKEIMEFVEQLDKPDFVKIYVAGEGAVLGYLSHYIDRDASRLNPLGLLLITIMLIVAFRRILPAILGNVVIIGTVTITVGLMAHSGVPFFVITNAMPVILIGISIADSIHIFSHYYECQAKHPDLSTKECIQESVLTMWKPVTLTTITTMAGFFGLYVSAYMPPFEYFGLFTAIGVLVAWFYSIFVLPALIVLLKPKVNKKWVKLQQESGNDIFAKLMILIGRIATAKPIITVAFFVLISLFGLKLSSDLVVNENRIDSFQTDEPLHIADKAINSHLEGTNTIDIVIETSQKEGIFDTRLLRQMEALQVYAETLPHVNGSMSVVDYLKQMNKSLNEGNANYYKLPDTRDQVAQFFLIYSASSDPTDFDNLVDYDYRMANIRLNLDTSEFVKTKSVIEDLQKYLDEHFVDANATANLSGRVTVNYHWIKDLGHSHFLSVVIALGCVLLVSALLFRSIPAGILAVLPVASSILVVYAAMVIRGVDLGIGTSMFASVAIGLGVDFAIHTIDRLKTLLQEGDGSVQSLLDKLYPSTGRALLFNYLAIAFGFGVLISSKVVPLNNFGTIVVLAVTMSFITSVALIPAIVMLFKPRFFFPNKDVDEEILPSSNGKLARSASLLPALLLGTSLLGFSADGQAQEKMTQDELDANMIMQKVDQVTEGHHLISKIKMTMINKKGDVRNREATSYRKNYGEEKRTFLVFRKPANVDGTSFLTYDYPDAGKDDDQWLYLPSLRKVRRISASDRGDYFLGTDFTYEDIKKSGKLELADFNFKHLGKETLTVDGNQIEAFKIEAKPKDKELVKVLGFGNSQLWINPNNWVIVKADYQDRKGRELRTYTATNVRQVEGIWTKHTLEVTNHKTGHYSKFEISDIDYHSSVEDNRFNKRAMKKS